MTDAPYPMDFIRQLQAEIAKLRATLADEMKGRQDAIAGAARLRAENERLQGELEEANYYWAIWAKRAHEGETDAQDYAVLLRRARDSRKRLVQLIRVKSERDWITSRGMQWVMERADQAEFKVKTWVREI